MAAIIILAAGASSRLGQPKQLLPYGDTNLLQHIINVALSIDVEAVLLVLGSQAEKILSHIDIAGLEVLVNGHWKEGMAASVRLGISTLEQSYPQVEGAIILLCDQPFVTTELLHQLLIVQKQSGKKIVASHYKNTAGVPALFMRSFFTQLQKLQGDEGARKLLRLFAEEVITIPFPDGETDIDTDSDYEKLVKTER